MHNLPQEIINQIILYTNLNIAIITKNTHAIKFFYNKPIHTVEWAEQCNHLETIIWLHRNLKVAAIV